MSMRILLIKIKHNCIIHDLCDIKVKQELMLSMSIPIHEYYIRTKKLDRL